MKRDLVLIIEAGLDAEIPVLIGTAGRSGATPHRSRCLEIVNNVLVELNRTARLAQIVSDQTSNDLIIEMSEHRISALGPVPSLTKTEIAESTNIVAQMGVEPVIAALVERAQIVVSGRCYDPAVFAAVPVMQGFSEALALYMGKILECAAIAGVSGRGSDCMLGTPDTCVFVLEVVNPERRCMVTSVAAHTLYEKSDPRWLPGPSGVLDLTECQSEQIDDRQGSGTQLVKNDQHTIQSEGVKPFGYRAISLAGIRSPDLNA